MNPVALVRRFIGLGAMGAIGLVGAKSWLDEGRANLRLDYYRDMAAFHEAAGLSACIRADAVVDAAMRQGWKVQEAPAACGATTILRAVPDEPAPWIPGPDGFLIGFDGAGCRIALPEDCD